MIKNAVLIIVVFVGLILICCNTKINQEKKNEFVFHKIYQSPKGASEVAMETLNELRNSKTDTIIFYKRTCISCCDFYYIFWAAKGQKFIDKFYYDIYDGQTHFFRINVSEDNIIRELNNNYNELKHTSVKDNIHTEGDNIMEGNTLDHYCYAKLNIYAHNDSFECRATDADFGKYTDYDFPQKQNRLPNDNYLENINSKWNALIIAIENQIAALPETDQRELSRLRTRRQTP